MPNLAIVRKALRAAGLKHVPVYFPPEDSSVDGVIELTYMALPSRFSIQVGDDGCYALNAHGEDERGFWGRIHMMDRSLTRVSREAAQKLSV